MKWKVATVVVALACLCPLAARAQEVIAGLDFLESKNNLSNEDLSSLSSLCPGAQVIGDPMIPLRGVPLDSSPACPGRNLGNSDTIIRRRNNTFGLDGGPSTIQIEIVALHLQSVQPFKVNVSGQPQLWTVDVTLSASTQPIGQMTIQKTQPNGGTFNSFLPVRPHLTFTRVSPCPSVVVCSVDGPIIQFNSNSVPWSYNPPPNEPLLSIPGCTTNFFPGVIPFAPGDSPGPTLLQAFSETAALRAHGVIPPPPPKLYQDSWQMAVHFTFHLLNISNDMQINDFRILRPRYIPNTPVGAYHDSTVYIKSVSLCDPRPFCPIQPPPDRWCRVNWDSLDPGYRKEAFWYFPPVPPQITAPEMDIVFSMPCYADPSVGATYEVDYECTWDCNVVDRGTFRFKCPPVTGCNPSCPPVVGVEPNQGSKNLRILDQNYPNPFNPQTTIRYRVDGNAQVLLKVYDSQGRLVRVLVNGSSPAGEHSVVWDGRDASGKVVSAGAYFYQIEVNGVRQGKKMVMLQ